MVAGYNPINEPCDALHYRLPAFYDRLEAAIRKVDSDHMLWLDGNTFSMEWKEFDNFLPNCVYTLHDYSTMGFPSGERYTGSDDQKRKLESQLLRKAQFMLNHKTPICNGEFGPVYADPNRDANAINTNKARAELLGQQLIVYDKYKIHWSIGLYKDIGMQGMLHLKPNSAYMQQINSFLEKKQALQLDAWGHQPSKEVEELMNPLVNWIDKHVPTSKDQYPTPWDTERQLARMINQSWLAKCLSDEFAELFADLSMEDVDRCARSFHFGKCQ